MGMNTTINWTGAASFSATTGSDHEIRMDGPPDHGGENQGARPMEMMLVGLGGCTAFDVMSILKKSRQSVTDCRAEVSAERADTVPSVFTSVHIHFHVTGQDLSEKRVARAIQLSAEQYCSASIMLEKAGVEITHDYTLYEG